MVRKTFASLTAVAALALVLAGCTSEPAEPENTTKVSESACDDLKATPTPAIDGVTVNNTFGKEPALEVPSTLRILQSERKVLTAGSGPRVTSTSQLSQMQFWVKSSTGFEAAANEQFASTAQNFDMLAQVFPGLPEQLLCAREGDRIAVALDTDDLAPTFAEQNGITEGVGIVIVVDMINVIRAAADGSDVFNAGFGLPSVVRDTTGRPGLVIPSGAAPAQTTSQTLLKGDGPAITADTTFFAHVLGVGWTDNDGKPFVNTWPGGTPSQLKMASFPAEVAAALEGQTIGSQVMVVVPMDKLSEEELTGTGFPADTALVFVIDLLGESM